MKKIFTIIILFTINVILGFSQNFKLPEDLYINTFYDSLYEIRLISGNKLELVNNSDEIVKEISYKIKHSFGIPFIELEEEIPDFLLSNKKLTKEDRIRVYFICALNEDGIYLYKFGGLVGHHIFDTTLSAKDKYFKTEYTKSSSYLIEKDIHYDETNLSLENWELPWVENVSGYGIGEYVEIKNTLPYENKKDFLLILNGYFSVEKPHLYKQNSRVKQIKVTGLKSGKEQILDVLDTPHPQTVDISFLDAQEPFRVTIMDVYKGSKYDDTCINCMELWDEAVVPYENTIAD